MRSRILTLTVLLAASVLSSAQLKQIAIIDLPGRPGFDSVAFANGPVQRGSDQRAVGLIGAHHNLEAVGFRAQHAPRLARLEQLKFHARE